MNRMKYKNCAFGKKKNCVEKIKCRKNFLWARKIFSRWKNESSRCNCKLCTICKKNCRLNFYPCVKYFPRFYYQIIIISTMYKNKIRIFFSFLLFSFLFFPKLLFFFAIYYSLSRASFRFWNRSKWRSRDETYYLLSRRSIRLENHRDNHSV